MIDTRHEKNDSLVRIQSHGGSVIVPRSHVTVLGFCHMIENVIKDDYLDVMESIQGKQAQFDPEVAEVYI
jgi:hypothetical protein